MNNELAMLWARDADGNIVAISDFKIHNLMVKAGDVGGRIPHGCVLPRQTSPFWIGQGATISSGCEFGVGCLIRPDAVICSNVQLGNNCEVGRGANIHSDVKIGSDLNIAANLNLIQGEFIQLSAYGHDVLVHYGRIDEGNHKGDNSVVITCDTLSSATYGRFINTYGRQMGWAIELVRLAVDAVARVHG